MTPPILDAGVGIPERAGGGGPLAGPELVLVVQERLEGGVGRHVPRRRAEQGHPRLEGGEHGLGGVDGLPHGEVQPTFSLLATDLPIGQGR